MSCTAWLWWERSVFSQSELEIWLRNVCKWGSRVNHLQSCTRGAAASRHSPSSSAPAFAFCSQELCRTLLLEGCNLPNDLGSQIHTACPRGVNESGIWPAFFQLVSLFRGALHLSGWHTDVQELSTSCEDVTSLTAACNYWMSCRAGDRYGSTGI